MSIRVARIEDVPFIVDMIRSAADEGVFHSKHLKGMVLLMADDRSFQSHNGILSSFSPYLNLHDEIIF